MREALGTPIGATAPVRRCLFGVTILLIEDSRAASEALRLFATASGARLRRADSLASAHRHLAIYRPNVVIVDLGLPDGNGLELIARLARASVPFDAVVAMSGNEAGSWEAAARDAGAAACLEKPLTSLGAFQECILDLLPARGVAAAPGTELPAEAEAALREALEADLRRALALLEAAVPAGDAETVAYCAQFLGALGDDGADAALAEAVRAAEAATPAEGGAALIDCLRRRLESGGLRGAA
jgi:DNA-binding NarL/FixJ family response regulator